jgi:hypothetical protein
MKLLVSLSSYGDKNLQYLNHVIDVYKSYKKYDVTIDVHCTVKLNRDDVNEIVHDNPETTCLFHRQDFIRERDNFDLFLFAEYDMLIQEHCIDIFLKYDKLLLIDHCLGFIRYENTPEGIPYLIDLVHRIRLTRARFSTAFILQRYSLKLFIDFFGHLLFYLLLVINYFQNYYHEPKYSPNEN